MCFCCVTCTFTQYKTKRLAGKKVSEMTYFVSSGTYNLNSNSKLNTQQPENMCNLYFYTVNTVTEKNNRNLERKKHKKRARTNFKRRREWTELQPKPFHFVPQLATVVVGRRKPRDESIVCQYKRRDKGLNSNEA